MTAPEFVDPAERLSQDDMATRTEAWFLEHALHVHQLRAPRHAAPTGVCANCGEQCHPAAVYCDSACRDDHEQRTAIRARQVGR